MFNAENIPEESSMQVNDEAYNYNYIIPSSPTLLLIALALSILDQVIEYAKEDLGWMIEPKDNDACIC
jgi:hypothetical protein